MDKEITRVVLLAMLRGYGRLRAIQMTLVRRPFYGRIRRSDARGEQFASYSNDEADKCNYHRTFASRQGEGVGTPSAFRIALAGSR